MLVATAGERLDDVPERRGVAFPAKCTFSSGPVDVESRKAFVEQLLELGLGRALA